jgi:single-strand DNA-binding protein
MAGVNKVILIGRVGKDPEVRQAGSTMVASFSMATSEKFKDKSGQLQESTEWHNIVLWGKQAELAGQYVKKGSMLYIEGSIKTETYDKDGQTKYVTKITGRQMQFLDSKGSSENNGGGFQQQQSQQFGQPQQQFGGQPQGFPQQQNVGYRDPNKNYDENGNELPF